MNNLELKPAVHFNNGMHIIEKKGSSYSIGTIYNVEGDFIHAFLNGEGRKSIPIERTYQIYVEKDDVYFLYNEGIEHLIHVLKHLIDEKPILSLDKGESEEIRDKKLLIYTEKMYPYMEREKIARDNKLKFIGDQAMIDKSKDMNYQEIGMLVDNIGKQHLTLENKGIQIIKSLTFKGYKLSPL